MLSRRKFIKAIVVLKVLLLQNVFLPFRGSATPAQEQSLKNREHVDFTPTMNLGCSEDGFSDVYKVQGGTAEENMERLISLLGGIENIVDNNDIVILKPNAQWWSQGMTNTDAMKAFMLAVLTSINFQGEIIIAENHQYKQFNGRGWTTDKRNGSFNYNELIEYFHNNGFFNVSKYHWRGAGVNPEPLEGDDAGTGRPISGPSEGDGYVWRDDIVYTSPNGKKCWMTYPVFTSEYSGITIDLKDGAWKNGQYLKDRKVKFINFSALNHHGWYAGVTASIKNLMGVVDMSCGFHAPSPDDTYNMHFIGVEKYIKHIDKIPSRHLANLRHKLRIRAHKNFHFTAGALGIFMKEICFPDLHIITAHHVGWGSRWDLSKSSYPKALLASHDPVALDYIAAKDILLKETPSSEDSSVPEINYVKLNDPDNTSGPFYRFLMECQKQGIGNLGEQKIRRIS